MMRFSILLLLAIVAHGNAHKLLVFVPSMANSQVQFSARVAETLAKGGHNVTMLFVNHFADFKVEVKIPQGINTYQLNALVKGYTKAGIEKQQAAVIFKETSLFDSKNMEHVKQFMKIIQDGCRQMLRNKEFLEWLKNEKFDLAYAYIYSTCPIGLVHYANIPSWVWLNSGPMMDFVAGAIGVPTVPSYVPPVVMEATDEMTFYERCKSFIGHGLTSILSRKLVSDAETQIFREELNDPTFPHTMDIGAKCPLVMVNTNPLYDLPRPLLAKVVNIGGLGVGFDSAKPLEGEFKKITETGKGTVIFSFGSVAAAHEMPLAWKNSLLEAFAYFKDYQFVMRYVGDDITDRLPKNVHISKWLPQKDILLHKNTKAFITHGGYNSLQEAISAGVPLVTIALFGDQPKNAKIAKKHGFAVNVEKGTLSKETLIAALKEVLENDSYSQKVKRISAMVRNQPIKADELLLKWSTFLAEFKTLEMLEPAGLKLNFLQYHSLDVIGFFAFVIFAVLFVVYKLLSFIVRKVCCRGSSRVTKEKTN